jgi:hypothetical protein
MQIQQGVLDPRSLCGIKDCLNRATSLYAWPMRLPVPICQTHANEVNQLYMVDPTMTPKRWLDWLKERGK